MTDTARTIDTEIHIDAPVDVVWRALTDLESYAAWNPYLFRIEGKALAGETIRVHSRPDVSADPMVQEISVISAAPYSMCWEGGLPDKSLLRGEHWFLLSESPPGKTHLRHYIKAPPTSGL